jgi:hypothetical protein
MEKIRNRLSLKKTVTPEATTIKIPPSTAKVRQYREPPTYTPALSTELHNLWSRIKNCTLSTTTDKNPPRVTVTFTLGDTTLQAQKSGAFTLKILKHLAVAELYPAAMKLITAHCNGLPPKNLHKMRKKKSPLSDAERDQAKALCQQFCTRWPALFTQDHIKLLAIGIHEQIVQTKQFTSEEVFLALRYWVSRKPYRYAIHVGAVRYDLKGEPAGMVVAEQVISRRRK